MNRLSILISLFFVSLLITACTDMEPSRGAALAPTAATPEAGVSAATLATPPTEARVQSVPSQAPATPIQPASLVREGIRWLAGHYIENLDESRLYAEAWSGAVGTLRHAGVDDFPPPPTYSSDPVTAAAQHMLAFLILEKLAEGRLQPQELVAGAFAEISNHRYICYTPSGATAPDGERTAVTGANQPALRFGLTFAPRPPLQIVDVYPGGPAQSAGLDAGQWVLAINGRVADSLGPAEAVALLDFREDRPNTFRIQDQDGGAHEITATPSGLPLVAHRVLPHNLALIRFASLSGDDSSQLINALYLLLTRLDGEGVEGWILDFRPNLGGQLTSELPSLFIERGRLFGLARREGPPIFANAHDNPVKLPIQRPMAVLVGPNTKHAGEMLVGILQAHGRATVVGEKTAGCFGGAPRVSLADGSTLLVKDIDILIGPDNRRLAQTGVTPDVFVRRTSDDDATGYEQQLEAAAQVLKSRIEKR